MGYLGVEVRASRQARAAAPVPTTTILRVSTVTGSRAEARGSENREKGGRREEEEEGRRSLRRGAARCSSSRAVGEE